MKDWGSYIVEQTQKGLMEYGTEGCGICHVFPEAHILTAAGTLCEGSPVKVAAREYSARIRQWGNFGPLLTSRTANEPELWDAVMCSSATVRNERIRQGSCSGRRETRQL